MKNQQSQARLKELLELKKAASSPVTRFLAHMNPFSYFYDQRRHQLALLRVGGRLDNELAEIEDLIVSSGEPTSIPNAFLQSLKLFQILKYDLILKIIKEVERRNKKESPAPEEAAAPEEITVPEPSAAPSPAPVLSKKEKEDFDPLADLPIPDGSELIDTKELQQLQMTASGILSQLVFSVPFEERKKLSAKNMEIRKYINLMGSSDVATANRAYRNLIIEFQQLKGMIEQMLQKSSADLSQKILVKEATNDLTRWLKRQKLNLLSDSDTRPLRIEADELIRESRKILNEFLNQVEGGGSGDASLLTLISFLEKINELFKVIYDLSFSHNSEEELKGFKDRKRKIKLISQRNQLTMRQARAELKQLTDKLAEYNV